MCGETTSKLSGSATSNYEGNYPPLSYVENTKISLYVESPHKFNFFSESELCDIKWEKSQCETLSFFKTALGNCYSLTYPNALSIYVLRKNLKSMT